MKPKVNIIWFRRDLRLTDNAALYYALKESTSVLPIFIFDKTILKKLEDKADKRIQFIHNALVEMQQKLLELGSTLDVFYSTPIECFQALTEKFNIQSVYTNHDYESYAIERDNTIKEFLQKQNIGFKTYKDQVIFEKNEVLKDDGKPYTVFTPYSKKMETKIE